MAESPTNKHSVGSIFQDLHMCNSKVGWGFLHPHIGGLAILWLQIAKSGEYPVISDINMDSALLNKYIS